MGLQAAVAGADLVLTGEGAFDETSLAGKGPGHVLALAAAAGVPALVVAGVVDPRAGGAPTISLVDTVGEEHARTAP
ncbi:hypothetical protein HR12_09130, partial [Microbacterium sp. SUBG005]